MQRSLPSKSPAQVNGSLKISAHREMKKSDLEEMLFAIMWIHPPHSSGQLTSPGLVTAGDLPVHLCVAGITSDTGERLT